ncbi:PucR family transcriptional regulator [Nocardia sp. NPDC059239]
MDAATLHAASMRVVAEDPVLREGIRRANRANVLHWAVSNVRDPGAPVSPNVGLEPLAIARDLVRRGLNESMLDSYRIGQDVAWRYWMAICFDLTQDAQELRELLDVSARSIAAFVDATIGAVAARMQAERAELTQGSHAERRETVVLVLEGAPIPRQRAEGRLGYALDGPHTAAVIWSDDPKADPGQLDSVATALARVAQVAAPLSIVASAVTRWVWVAGRVDAGEVATLLGDAAAVRVALGPLDREIDGFRRSHFDALTTQRMLTRLASPERLATYDSVALASLVTEDMERADRFVRDTLGDLAEADPEIRAAVLTFVREQCNAVRAANRLFTHRNTLLRRISRAEEMLPRPLAENSVEVAVALDILHWRGVSP